MIREILTSSNLRDEKRLYEILASLKSRLQESLTSAGNSTAVMRAASYDSPMSWFQDRTSGISFYHLVEDLEEEPLDMERLKRMPGMVIHVVQPGESLWDIAREHAASCAAVAELNELKEEAVRPGQKLLLIKEISGRGNGGTV